MHPIVDNFLQRPTSHKAAFWAGSLIFVSFIFWQYFYKDKAGQLEELTMKIGQLNAQIAHERRLSANLEKFRKEIRTLEAKRKLAVELLPGSREIPGLLESVATLAKDAGLEVLRFAPRPEANMGFYATVPVYIELRGTYHDVAAFFDEISRLSRIVNVGDIYFFKPRGVEEDAHVKIDAQCVVTTFKYLDVDEAVLQDADEDKKKRKKRSKKEEA